ncbi:MAG TPA: formate dehydrogenase subunit gamma [Aquabacterium sp.]|nr:formate dehydrogenase subunit gamma [Aquabacterium sp.]HQC98467.1 formate dehydrogenase subunit gamma [Aquabacterium sp.]
MSLTFRQLLAAAALSLAAGASLGQAAAPAAADAATAPKAPPAGFVAPAEPRADENQAQRARSQPGNNAPAWRAVRESGIQPGTSNLPGAEKGVLIQPFVQYPGSRLTNAGEAWRQVRNQWLLPYGGSLLLIVVIALGLFYWRKGALGHDHPDTGLIIERFTPLERAAHWTNAIAFVTLAVSGIVMAFGKFFLLPVIGSTLFGWLTFALKTVHNFVGPLFAVSLVIVLVTFVKDNIATVWDFKWLMSGGSLLGDQEIPSHRFNPAEKGMFWWGICVPGIFVVGSGLVLDKLLPGLGDLRGEMQVAHMIHAVAAILMMTFLLGHIYMGTVGTRGAYKAMRTGYVNEGWAREHHALWLDDVKAGKIPAQRSDVAQPAAGVGSAAPQA